jgi:hypothetical protein
MDSVMQSRRFGIIGSLVGLLALLGSALTFLLPQTFLHQPIHQATQVTEVLGTGAAALGVIAIALAVLAVILKEEKLLAGVAAVLGIVAIIAQVWWALIIVAIAIVILHSLLG